MLGQGHGLRYPSWYSVSAMLGTLCVTRVASGLRTEDSSIGHHGTAKLSCYQEPCPRKDVTEWRKTVCRLVSSLETRPNVCGPRMSRRARRERGLATLDTRLHKRRLALSWLTPVQHFSNIYMRSLSRLRAF